jgi:O-antigen/teichoic acid export membrane protein
MLTADRILNYLRANTDVALVGALLGSRMVGLYVMATALARLPFEKLGSALEPVAYPTFARLRGDTAEQRRYFRLLSLGTMAFALPMCLGLIVTAAVLVPVVIGAQWAAVVRPLQVAAAVTPLVFHVSLISALFNANGRVDLNLRVTTLMAASTIAAVLVGVHFGIVGVAAASGIAFAGVWVYAAILGLQMLELQWKDIAKTLYPAISASLGMAACAYALSLALPIGWPPLGRLVIECVVGASTYVAWGFLLHHNTVVPHLRSVRTAWSTR